MKGLADMATMEGVKSAPISIKPPGSFLTENKLGLQDLRSLVCDLNTLLEATLKTVDEHMEESYGIDQSLVPSEYH